ncbi:alpha/beta fold hydrolase [Nostocaceae cyanobacterium CENA369]|uniref:Alpha/beta fold hydrolase n=1 Tax=Dendronalium phyllosphericum CENA369 TaxID=1725256 RepID=A0A8J7I3Y8_9NOST|nr:alpha/beta fold hydrolase [Dendronalium phyllosphericum]MBH8573588.1 alpha/beta fold hydrolase [Dendronalium phyllosphericum CENA369]
MNILIWAIAIILLIYVLVVASSARLLIKPKRQKIWTNPRQDVGLDYEDVEFPAQDGVSIKGWFIPALQTPAATVIMVHGWPWNRIGTKADDILGDLPGSKPINLLPFTKALHERNYNVLMFDLRNHGESDAKIPLTSGWLEKRDLLGAIKYAKSRAEVDSNRIGTIGFSMGGNTVVFTLPHSTDIKAAAAVQPNTSAIFGQRYRADKFGPLDKLFGPAIEILYRLSGGPSTAFIQPAYEAAGARDIPVLYVQGTGDKWGSVDDVANMVASTPNAVEPLYPETDHRFGGYQYVVDNPDKVLTFFDKYLSK